MSETQEIERFRRILNVYNEINLEKMAKLIGFKDSINLEKWIIELPEKYSAYLTIKGQNVIINQNVSQYIDELLTQFKKWDADLKLKTQKVLSKSINEVAEPLESSSFLSYGEEKPLGNYGKKFLKLFNSYTHISKKRFEQVFELEELTTIDSWLLTLPKELGVFLNVSYDQLNFERKTSEIIQVQIADHFNKWIDKFLDGLTQMDKSAIIAESQRREKLLGQNYQKYYSTEIKEREEKYLIFQLYGRHEFVTRSDYGDRTYTAFNINEKVQYLVEDFRPDIIAKKKQQCIQYGLTQESGKKYYYTSPAGRHISRIIKPSEKDFTIELRHLLRVFKPKQHIAKTSLKKNIEKDLVKVNNSERMCVRCANIFKPVSWDGWEDKYLTTNDVYVCEDCNPSLKKVIEEETIKRNNYTQQEAILKAKESRFKKLFFIDIVLVLTNLMIISLLIFPVQLISISILTCAAIWLLIKWRRVSRSTTENNTSEKDRRFAVLYNLIRYDGSLLIPE